MSAPRLPELPQRELDALLDHIYEYGTTSEGVSRLVRALQAATWAAAMEAAAQTCDEREQQALAQTQYLAALGAATCAAAIRAQAQHKGESNAD